ncbi:MAG: hypothetical protein EKK31_18550 [Hyphomicrobiales bacterium]|nr:MAG: hypothetical protein EKK31_18550 [Hyphomicrobiales bacterium]
MSIFSHLWSRFSTRTRRGSAATEALPSNSLNSQAVDHELQLIERKTIEIIEREQTQRAEDIRGRARRSPERFAALLKPFGHSNSQWEALKAGMQPGDELWTFTSSPASWRALAGSAGIALVREGRIVATIVTMKN